MNDQFRTQTAVNLRRFAKALALAADALEYGTSDTIPDSVGSVFYGLGQGLQATTTNDKTFQRSQARAISSVTDAEATRAAVVQLHANTAGNPQADALARKNAYDTLIRMREATRAALFHIGIVEALNNAADHALDKAMYERAITLCDAALQLDPDNTDAQKMRDEAENYRIASTKVEQGLQFINNDQPQLALGQAEQALEHVPDYPPALALQQRAQEAITNAEVAQLLTDALQAFENERYDEAVRLCDEIFAHVNDHAEAAKLRTRAEAAIQAAETSKPPELMWEEVEIARQITGGEEAMAKGSPHDALRIANEILELDPDNAIALDLRDRAQQAMTNAEVTLLHDDALQAFEAGDYDRVITLCDEIFMHREDHAEATDLQQRAQEKIDEVEDPDPIATAYALIVGETDPIQVLQLATQAITDASEDDRVLILQAIVGVANVRLALDADLAEQAATAADKTVALLEPNLIPVMSIIDPATRDALDAAQVRTTQTGEEGEAVNPNENTSELRDALPSEEPAEAVTVD